MDEKLHRIVQFLRKNNNHYFESSDIAFHLKYDEQYTNDALLQLSQMQLVTMSNDSQGTIVWYAAEHWNQAETENFSERDKFPDTEKNRAVKVFDEGTQKNHAFHELIEKVEMEKKPFPLGLVIVSVVFLVLIGLSLYAGKRYVDRQFNDLGIRVNAAATKSEFTSFSEKTISSDEKLGLKLEVLAGRTDTVNINVDSLRIKDSLIQKQIIDLTKQIVDLQRDFRRR